MQPNFRDSALVAKQGRMPVRRPKKKPPIYALCFYVPESHVESVKEALFEAGAGRVGDYECCAWQVLGSGQFRPMAGSQPFLGHEGQLEIVPEFRVEMVCDATRIEAVIDALLASHPYEEPAYHYWPVETRASTQA
jgi:hypothetical protein